MSQQTRRTQEEAMVSLIFVSVLFGDYHDSLTLSLSLSTFRHAAPRPLPCCALPLIRSRKASAHTELYVSISSSIVLGHQ